MISPGEKIEFSLCVISDLFEISLSDSVCCSLYYGHSYCRTFLIREFLAFHE